MAGDDQSSPELGKNSAEAMVNQTKSTGRQSKGRHAHLGVPHGWRRLGGVAGLEEEDDGLPAYHGGDENNTERKREDVGSFFMYTRSSAATHGRRHSSERRLLWRRVGMLCSVRSKCGGVDGCRGVTELCKMLDVEVTPNRKESGRSWSSGGLSARRRHCDSGEAAQGLRIRYL